jgi:excisionase family DNA binding protein
MMNVSPDDDVLDVRGAMALLKIGRDAIYSGVARLEIPHRRIGRHIRFSRAALMRWLDSCGSQRDAERQD